MAVTESDPVVSICVQKHLQEQLAYAEIRLFLSNQFVLDPVMFMQLHGKRPEDLGGAELRKAYPAALQLGLTAPSNAPHGFTTKFQSGKFFPSLD